MSFGFGIGDFIAIGELCWKLYSQVYKVSRDAPEELRGLNQELGNFHNTIRLLLEELKNKDSVLFNSGDVRMDTVRRVVSHSEETLKKMQQLSERHADLQTSSTTPEKRRRLRIYWDQLKYTRELHNINDLRSKIMLHNSQLTLILQGAQNSSLERIEKQNTQTDQKLDELRQLIVSNTAQRDSPVLTVPLDPIILMELTNVFLQKAESDNRPWASIGIDNWLQAGQWWLMKAQIQLVTAYPVDEPQRIYHQGYADILKACWILTDVIAIHPQRSHMGASNDRRAHHIQRLTQGAISKLKSFSFIMLRLEDFLACSLDIWNLPISTALTPSRQYTDNQQGVRWQTQDGQLLFQRFAEYQDHNLKLPIECIVVIEILNEQSTSSLLSNLIVQNFMGQDIFKVQLSGELNGKICGKYLPIKFITKHDERLLDCIVESLFVTRRSLLPHTIDASMVYSVAILRACISARNAFFNPKCYRDTAYEDISILNQSKQQLQITPETHLSTSFQSAAYRAVKYLDQCFDCFPSKYDRLFWKLQHHCIWMLIYWVSDTFEAFSELFGAIGFHSPDFHPVSQGCLTLSSLLKKDTEYPQKFRLLTGLRQDSNVSSIDNLRTAIEEDDIALLQIMIKNTKREAIIQNWQTLWIDAQNQLKFDALDVLISVPGASLDSILLSLFGLEGKKLQKLWIFVQSRLENLSDISKFQLRSAQIDDLSLLVCCKMLYKGSIQELMIRLELIQQFRIAFGISDPTTDEVDTRLLYFRPLNSPNDYIREIISMILALSDSIRNIHPAITFTVTHKYPGPNQFSDIDFIFKWPLNLMFGVFLDLETVQYLYYGGSDMRAKLEEQDILQKFLQTITVSDARKQSCHLKGICYNVFLLTKSNRLCHGFLFTIWEKMCRVIFENDCRDLYDVADVSPGLTWLRIQNQLYPDHAEDICIKKAKSWPKALLTQDHWDDWRERLMNLFTRT